jgi:hypothetical protein
MGPSSAPLGGARLGCSKYSWATEYQGMDSQTDALFSNTSWLHRLHTNAHVPADFLRCSRTRRDLHAASRSPGSRSFGEQRIARIALFEDGACDFAKTTPERDSSTLTRCSPQRRGCHTPCCGRQRCMTDATRWSWSKRNILIVTWSVASCVRSAPSWNGGRWNASPEAARASSALRRAVRCDPSGARGGARERSGGGAARRASAQEARRARRASSQVHRGESARVAQRERSNIQILSEVRRLRMQRSSSARR